MDNLVDLDSLTRRTRRREFEDGLLDFTVAASLLVFSLGVWFFTSTTGLTWFATALVKQREFTLIALIGLAALVILVPAGGRRLVERWRLENQAASHGFVKSLPWQISPKTNLLAGALGVAIILAAFGLWIAGLIKAENALRTLAAASGMATGLVYLRMGVELEIPRYRWSGLIGGLLSAGLPFLPVDFSQSWLIFGLVWAAILSISGLHGWKEARQPKKAGRGG